MHTLVGIIRTGSELEQALGKLDDLKARAEKAGVTGTRAYNPGWHLAMDLRSLLTVAEAIARAASMRTESRGAHTRDDYQATDPEWGKWNLSISQNPDGTMKLEKTPLPEMPAELAALFEEGK
jgi:succinate dehydrogenase / fumarate reductase flavoprotein subunit